MGIVLADGYSDLTETSNRFFKRDQGTPGFGDTIRWTDYNGADALAIIRHATPGAIQLAIMNSGTSPTATPSAANSLLIAQDDALSIGMGKPIDFFNVAGTNFANLYHQNSVNDILVTDDSFRVAVALNVGATNTATAVGDGYLARDLRVARAFNVGTTNTATAAGNAYMAGGLLVGTGTAALTTANGRVTAGEHFVLGVDEGQFRGVIASAATDTVVVLGTATDTTPGSEHFAIDAAGKLSWGPGGASARDTTLARSGINVLTASGAVIATTSVTANTGFRSVGTTNATDIIVVLGTATDTTAGGEHFAIQASGRMGWGPGGATARDTFLERIAVAGLQITNDLTLLGRMTSVNATVTGTVTAQDVTINGTLTTTGPVLTQSPAARAVASGTTVATATATALALDSSTYDNDSMYDATNDRLKATRAGKYRISGCAEYPGSAAGTLRWTRLRVNNTTDIANQTDAHPAGTFGTSQTQHCVTTTYTLAINDYVTVYAYQDTGGNQSVTGHMAMEFVST